jgi:hypothetical protein
MRELNRKGILPVAAVWASLCCSCLAQIYSTNTIGHVQAIKIAAQLKKGMTEEQVNQFMATNKLFSGISVGDNFAWGQFFDLTDNCSLHLDFDGNNWGQDGASSLQAAYIQSNLVDIISIPLDKASKENPIDMQNEEAKAREDRYERWLQPKLASGYFQEKTFVLSNRAPDEAALSLLFDRHRGNVPDEGGGMGTIEGSNIVQITASTNDMVIWGKVVREFDQPAKK